MSSSDPERLGELFQNYKVPLQVYPRPSIYRVFRLWPIMAALLWAAESLAADVPVATTSNIVILELSGTVEYLRPDVVEWHRARAGQLLFGGDRLRTGRNGHATISVLGDPAQIGRLSEWEVQRLPVQSESALYKLWHGLLYFFHREHPANVRFDTATAVASVRGTEFVLEAREDGSTVLTTFEGEVLLSNDTGEIALTNLEQGVATPGQAPKRVPMINAINIIQWCLYYPGVLDPDELPLDAAQAAALQDSLTAYRNGDLVRALEAFPAGRQPASNGETVYRAALLLSVGEVDGAEALLRPLMASPGPADERIRRLAEALQKIIAAVKFQVPESAIKPEIASEWLAESYYLQSRSDLPGAVQAAKKAVGLSPRFGFGWTRVAELEFCFGRTPRAEEALERGLALAPRNAQARALEGFLLSDQNRIKAARESFERAIELDGRLGNAWLGRGLCRIRSGDLQGGRQDLKIAAALEPNRSLLRSYLGKAYTVAGDYTLANNELKRASDLDPKDPTVGLYSALLKQQQNRINQAIGDLEAAQVLMVTPLFAASARTLSELAAILGREDEAQKYKRLSEQIRKAYLERFLDQSSGKVGLGTEASQAFALYLNLLPEEQRPAARQVLLDDIRLRHEGHLSTGIFGTKFMLDVLSRAGEADLASTIVNQKTYPGWGYMLENGATTLWEHWKGSDNTYSHNHPMFGSVSEWFYHWLGGIQPAPEAVGFDRIIIRPQAVKDLKWVRCSYDSVRGRILSNWKRDGNLLKLEVEIPANTTATVYVPASGPGQVKESGKPAADSQGVHFVKQVGGRSIFEIGSGHYVFEAAQPSSKGGNPK